MNNFNFHRPKTLSEAVAALQGTGERKALAGGQSLLPVMKLDMAQPTDLVSLTQLTELQGIQEEGTHLHVGAACTHAEVAESTIVRGMIPALAQLAGHIGDAQVRNRGTLGGSLAHADPAADYPAAFVALKGEVVTDRRTIGCDDFFTGMFETALGLEEIITAVHFYRPEKACYAKYANPASKYAVAGVMVAKYADGVRVAVTGAGTSVFRVPEMESQLTANFSPDAIADVSVSAEGLNDEPGFGPEFRAHLVGVMARRAVQGAI